MIVSIKVKCVREVVSGSLGLGAAPPPIPQPARGGARPLGDQWRWAGARRPRTGRAGRARRACSRGRGPPGGRSAAQIKIQEF